MKSFYKNVTTLLAIHRFYAQSFVVYRLSGRVHFFVVFLFFVVNFSKIC